MKALVVYYSRTDTTRRVAEDVQRRLGCDIEAIVPKDGYRHFTGWLRAGRSAMKGRTVEIGPLRSDVQGYDIVIVGTPIWARTISVPVRSLLARDGGRIRRAAFLITSGGPDREAAFKAMEGACGRPPVAKLGVRTRDVRRGAHAAAVDAFVDELRSAVP